MAVVLVGLLALLLPCAVAEARDAPTDNSLTGPARVVDGDTLDIAGTRVRLEGVDAPETGQTCASAGGETWDCGAAASRGLLELTRGQDVHCEPRGRDKYGRYLGVCFSGNLELNAELVRRGLAWAFLAYSRAYVAVEAEAKAQRVGIWQAETQPAWEWRRQLWARAEQTAPQGCAIKGNVSRNGHIYHLPWSPWYHKVSIDERRGERWFCSETEAIAAGWRPAGAR